MITFPDFPSPDQPPFTAEASPMLVPAIALVGPSNSGKTELICRLLTWLGSRGLKVAAVKHSHRRLPVDQPGKDTWRFHRAGARVVALAAPGILQVTQTPDRDPELATVLAALGPDLDLILVEGYKHGLLPKLVMVPAGASLGESQNYPRIIGYISEQPLPAEQPVFSPSQVAEIGAFILGQTQT
ncbi:MAG: molybdopterin-guanine dinucleotide biosynthesis protein B [Deltaproteobacteria bacterium]|nr:molybdopterin-guanine dinucleotide biosynthesis protein B [Deltaproteobacteria bacterium]MBW1953695.1 molybdopterin-guanine dinucleotide biosynthesis protein B [Deltaproteobacteria bacterium]MBW1987643.1 molybdopterin-guanine dinucleotide biosynthesis protein B [Deltaproteobacteria bacterium]